jgi:oxygen-independent coproporphyrinogen III oxidase
MAQGKLMIAANSAMANLIVEPELLRRYPQKGPRYTSYPTAPQFHERFGIQQWIEQAQRSNQAVGQACPRPLSIYLHVPFCTSPCFYCGCNKVITRDFSRAEPYLQRLCKEIDLTSPHFTTNRKVRQVHFGGGTPNFLTPQQIARLMEKLAQRYSLVSDTDRDYSIEIDPRAVEKSDIKALAEIGFNRVSLGVQDFDPVVQQAVNRIQGVEQTLDILQAARSAGFKSINVDLIFGLPKQTLLGFSQTLDTVISAKPDRLAIYSYAHMPAMFKPQRQINEADLPDSETKLALLQLAVEKLSQAGYHYIGMDHFALESDELYQARLSGDLHRNFMGYCTHADSDLIGLGVSAISHIGQSYAQNPRDLISYEASIDANQLAVWRGIELSKDDIIRADVIAQLMCQARVRVDQIEATYGIDFSQYFASDIRRLKPMVLDGLITRSAKHLQVSTRGQLLLRSIAACFDRYLHRQPQVSPA